MLQNISKKYKSSNHFEAFFEYATMGILVTDGDGQITAINPFALKEFGYSEEELIGKKIEILIPQKILSQAYSSSGKICRKPSKPADGPGNGFIWYQKGWHQNFP